MMNRRPAMRGDFSTAFIREIQNAMSGNRAISWVLLKEILLEGPPGTGETIVDVAVTTIMLSLGKKGLIVSHDKKTARFNQLIATL